MKKLFKYIVCIIFCLSGIIFAETDCLKLIRNDGDNAYDDTQLLYAFNMAELAKKNCVELSAATWRFQNPIILPPQMTLKGSYTGEHTYDAKGTNIECNYGAGLDSAAGRSNSCIIMRPGSIVNGITMVWPGNKGKTTPISYPWGITCVGEASSPIIYDAGRCVVKNTTLANAYYGINFGVEANDHHLENVNVGAYRLGIKVDNISSLGIIDNVKIKPDYIKDYYKVSYTSTIGNLISNYTFTNTIGLQINRSDWGDLKNILVSEAYDGYKFDLNLTNATYKDPYLKGGTWWQNPQVYIVNATCLQCNYAIHAYTIQKPAGLQFMNANMEGKIRVEGYNWGPLHFANSVLTYMVDPRETEVLSHIHDVSKNSNISILSSTIITGSNNPYIPFNAAVFFTSGTVALSDVVLKNGGNQGTDAVQLAVYGDKSFIAWTDGYYVGYPTNLRMRQYKNDGSIALKITNVSIYNVIEGN